MKTSPPVSIDPDTRVATLEFTVCLLFWVAKLETSHWHILPLKANYGFMSSFMDIQTRLGMQVLKIWTQLCGPTNRKICKQNKSSWNSKLMSRKNTKTEIFAQALICWTVWPNTVELNLNHKFGHLVRLPFKKSQKLSRYLFFQICKT